ncbi:MAG: amidase [Alphaproteobacteria bacterium]|nr:amidase [Alphaproteobacteria bacterium]
MAAFAEYRNYDAMALAELVRTKKVTPQELLDAALARSKQVNGKLNAIVLDHEDVARKAIKDGLPQGPFSGVPFLLKDLGQQLKGTVTTGSLSLLRESVAAIDTTYVERCKKAGLVIFGKTHSPELGLSPSSESRMWGATRNPWDTSRIAGGSSGGAAAAVAAGIVPVAHATDGGGSIRIPASCCGLFGLKPTRARTPGGPKRGEGWGGLSVGHVVSRTVRDSAAFLDATAGAAPGDPYAAPAPARAFLEETKAKPNKLRIAVSTTPAIPGEVDPDCVHAVHEAARLCASLGHEVEEAAPQFDGLDIMTAQGVVISANVAFTIDEAAAALGRTARAEDVEHATWFRVERARATDSSAYAKAMNTLHYAGRTFAAFMEDYDVILQPVMAKPPLPLGILDMERRDLEAMYREMIAFIPYTGIYNITGQPSMSMPLHWNEAGLPIGTMFTSRFGDEATLFRLAAQLEQAKPWTDRYAKL